MFIIRKLRVKCLDKKNMKVTMLQIFKRKTCFDKNFFESSNAIVEINEIILHLLHLAHYLIEVVLV